MLSEWAGIKTPCYTVGHVVALQVNTGYVWLSFVNLILFSLFLKKALWQIFTVATIVHNQNYFLYINCFYGCQLLSYNKRLNIWPPVLVFSLTDCQSY